MTYSFFDKLNNISTKEYAPVPFWSWNSEILPNEAIRQIQQMKEVGFGGFIIHARAGLKTEYLSDKWFKCVKACIEEANKLNMCVWIYDEFGYPSGFVGGTLLNNAYNLAEYLEYKVLDYFDQDAFVVYQKVQDKYIRIERQTESNCYYTIYKLKSSCNVDILNPRVVDLFIGKVYEEYYSRFSEYFGNVIRGFFTDEPQYYRYSTPYSRSIEREFLSNNGETLKDGLINLFLNDESAYQFRVKYYKLLNKTYTLNYYKRIYDWCNNHGCQLTGHTVEEPHIYSQMWGSAGAMPSYRYCDVPGIDHLCQQMDGVIEGIQVESVSMQFGKRQVMSESFACTGYDANFRTLKYIGDYQYALGVNYLVVHLMNYSMQGSGYKDFPQSFSAHAPWWSDMRLFNDYYKKLGFIFANTEKKVDILLIHPMQDSYLTYDRKKDRESVLDVDKSFFELSNQLAQNGIAFHYADETILNDTAEVIKNTIHIKNKSYKYVILPKRKSINKSTHDLLKKFVSCNGKLCIL